MVLAATAAIYGTLPWAPAVWFAVRRATGGSSDALAAATLAAMAALGVVALWRHGRLSLGTTSGLLAVASLYAVALVSIPLTPAEKLHFVSYGALAWLVYRALILDLATWPARAAAVGIVAALGLGDELIQHVLPNRHFEWKDVALNALSGTLAVMAIAWWERR